MQTGYGCKKTPTGLRGYGKLKTPPTVRLSAKSLDEHLSDGTELQFVS